MKYDIKTLLALSQHASPEIERFRALALGRMCFAPVRFFFPTNHPKSFRKPTPEAQGKFQCFVREIYYSIKTDFELLKP